MARRRASSEGTGIIFSLSALFLKKRKTCEEMHRQWLTRNVQAHTHAEEGVRVSVRVLFFLVYACARFSRATRHGMQCVCVCVCVRMYARGGEQISPTLHLLLHPLVS